MSGRHRQDVQAVPVDSFFTAAPSRLYCTTRFRGRAQGGDGCVRAAGAADSHGRRWWISAQVPPLPPATTDGGDAATTTRVRSSRQSLLLAKAALSPRRVKPSPHPSKASRCRSTKRLGQPARRGLRPTTSRRLVCMPTPARHAPRRTLGWREILVAMSCRHAIADSGPKAKW